MAKTAIALFNDPAIVEGVVKEIEDLGIPKKELQILKEQALFPVDGVMSFTRLEFEVELKHALDEIGAEESEEQAYLKGLRDGCVLVLASGPDAKVEEAAEIMNRAGAKDLEEKKGSEPELPEPEYDDAVPDRGAPVQAGRIREAGSGAQLFVW